MTRILVTGGTGSLGRPTVARLVAAGETVRVLTRQEQVDTPAGVAVVRGDLATGAGLAEAVAGVEIVIHAASGGWGRGDEMVETRRLVVAARAAGVRHLVYIAIVGIDRHPFAYYRAKLAGEGVVQAGGVPWTILRATQFHSLAARFFAAQARLPALLIPRGLRFQPVDEGEVATRLAALALAPPAGRADDMGGPEILTVEAVARGYLAAIGSRKPVLGIPFAGKAAAAFRAGLHLAPAHRDGTITWNDYLRRHYGAVGETHRREEARRVGSL